MTTPSNTPASSGSGRPLFDHIGAVIADWAADDPGALAVVDDTRPVTVGELDRRIDTQVADIATRTSDRGRVATHAPASAELLATLYAVPRSGRVLVPINTRLADTAKLAQLRRAEVELLIGDPIDGFDGTTIPLTELGRTPRRAEATRVIDRNHDDVAWIIFTSGSTGEPKGVLITHTSLAAAVTATAAARPIADDDVYLYPFPLFHIAAYNVIHAHARRRPVVLPPRFDARRIIELCHAHRVTTMSSTATMLRMLLDALADDPRLGPPVSLRSIAYGAAPMPAELLVEAAEVLGCDFAQGYGSTELSGNAVFLGPQEHRRGLTDDRAILRAAGFPAPGVEIRIADAHGDELAAGEAGEVTVRAAQVCAGYLDDPITTADTIRDGWLHTGDIGILDDRGLLRIVDRAKDMVVTGGENVASRAVEDALRSHPDVADVAVVGLPDPRWGEAVTAAVVATADSGLRGDVWRRAPESFVAALGDLAACDLAGYAKPRNVFVGPELPVNANGKIDKRRLRTLLAESPGSTTSP
ncbi:MAG: AMP-binding protein [Actinobacteria bacterium]|nr:AMP-binding protein [Actinomycetota bacterium]